LIPESKIFSIYDSRKPTVALSQLSLWLLDDQKKTWPQLAEAYKLLSSAEKRTIQCDGFDVVVQHNSSRHTSASSKVDPISIGARPCFLCVEDLPADQKAIVYDNEFLILCNPAPIFSHHYTIVSLTHTPQAIEGNVTTMLKLAKAMSPSLGIFYNGPQSGASAPDHLHFQASPANAIPVEQDAGDEARRVLIRKIDDMPLIVLKNFGRGAIIIEGDEMLRMQEMCLRLIHFLKKKFNLNDEPMINIHCSFQKDFWRLIIFPRRKHRPDVYFKEGQEKILVSPGLVDVGGLIITPLKKDFERLDRFLVEDILREVSFDTSMAEFVINNL
jgi:ATP adenylyltransferase/5',5'''-P-1,P-4-tetraphosphate phosphorylase II